ncbi:alpha/beta-hydrolase [Daldinia caldariorum]|uniref:alpha/beta-hydrolase n=1 Tax=Daldinia caldariorum TaxID=326644 RepID=UPI0020075B14|nr:alpha/beta-hydrolase [Daldinia caldariorum]KAI1464598.1 alpha/beta-hydrolase [Daldinia caldariorum]
MASQIRSSGYVPRDSVQLFYEREGSSGARSILFVHGLGGTTNTFQPLVSGLQDFDLVRFDWAGHGRSSLPKSTSVESYLADCEAIIRHLELKDILVVGHSFGGLISLHLAAKHPDIVKGVVAFGPVRPPPEAGQKALADRATAVRNQGMGAVADAVVSNAFSPKSLVNKKGEVALAREMLTRQDPRGYALALDALAGSSEPAWKQIKANVLVLTGEEDKISTATAGADIVKEIRPGAKRVVFKDTGHWHTLESTEESVKAIISVAKDIT